MSAKRLDENKNKLSQSLANKNKLSQGHRSTVMGRFNQTLSEADRRAAAAVSFSRDQERKIHAPKIRTLLFTEERRPLLSEM